MPSLKDLRNRIDSVKSTRKITQAMKMVAASKLRKAQEAAERGRLYSDNMHELVTDLSSNNDSYHPLLSAPEVSNMFMLIAITADRGLCGAFNSSIVKAVINKLRELEKRDKKVELYCIGSKGYESLRVALPNNKINNASSNIVGDITYSDINKIGFDILKKFYNKDFDVCYLYYNFFKSVISQIVTEQTLIPYKVENKNKVKNPLSNLDKEKNIFEYEPDEETILSELLPKNISVQLYKASLEAKASEQGARMAAMDNATRNAGDMIDNLTLHYNRQRQAMITKELIEIISGAEAL